MAAASSVAEDGNRLLCFDLDGPGEPFYSDGMVSAHGLVWDPERAVLWALGFDALRTYRLEGWNTQRPALVCEVTLELPDTGGHDLQAVPGTSELIVTTSRNVWCFDRDGQRFALHPLLGQEGHVKGVSVNPDTGRIAYVQAEGDHWWAERIHFLEPQGVLHVPGEHFYKTRWNSAEDL